MTLRQLVSRRDFVRTVASVAATAGPLRPLFGDSLHLGRVLPPQPPSQVLVLGAGLKLVRSFSWQEEEWSGGAYAIYEPGQMFSLLPHIAAPDGRIHFAGEHTSPWHGWMRGALHSGIRVAREIGARVARGS